MPRKKKLTECCGHAKCVCASAAEAERLNPSDTSQLWYFATENGTCACDGRLETARDVRRLGVCDGCGQLVLEGHRHSGKRLHTRCAVKMLGLEQCVALGFGPTMRLCCLGEAGMETLMSLMAEARHV